MSEGAAWIKLACRLPVMWWWLVQPSTLSLLLTCCVPSACPLAGGEGVGCRPAGSLPWYVPSPLSSSSFIQTFVGPIHHMIFAPSHSSSLCVFLGVSCRQEGEAPILDVISANGRGGTARGANGGGSCGWVFRGRAFCQKDGECGASCAMPCHSSLSPTLCPSRPVGGREKHVDCHHQVVGARTANRPTQP